MTRRRRVVTLAVAAAGLVIAGLAAERSITGAPAAPKAPPAAPVEVVSATRAVVTDWQPHLQAVGNLRAVRGADLSAETAGIVDQIRFRSGQDVHRGDILVELRLNDEPARLAQAQAAADLASVNLGRDTRQLAAEAVSRAVVDADRSTLDADRAAVAAEQALVAEKIVRAPFDGRLGVRLVDPGQYLAPGTAMVTLQALDPIYADFYLPERSVALLHVGDGASVTVDAWPGRRFAARIAAITPRVDQASRTVLVRATLDNHDGALLPGMFATVAIASGAATPRLTVPQAAISFSTYGNTVFVLRRDASGRLVASRTDVATGPTRGEQVAVLSGLAAGDQVVTAGQVKLHDGTPVTVDDRIEPGDSPDPSVPEE